MASQTKQGGNAQFEIPGRNRVAGCQWAAILLFTCLALCTNTAEALQIDLRDVGNLPMSAQRMAAFQEAAHLWENLLANSITVKINVAWDTAGAMANPVDRVEYWCAKTTHSWHDVWTAMFLNNDSTAELQAIMQLPKQSIPFIDRFSPQIGSQSTNKVTICTANAKALWPLSPTVDSFWSPELKHNADGEVRFNRDYINEYDIDRSDGITHLQIDFVAAAAHAIGHILGFQSVTDVRDYYTSFIPFDYDAHPHILDVWRFAWTGASHQLLTDDRLLTGTINGSTAEYDDSVLRAFLSLGIGDLATIDASDPNCDSPSHECSASHWRGGQGNLMDPSVPWAPHFPGAPLTNLTADDIHAMDYIGYDVMFTTLRNDVRGYIRQWTLGMYDPVDITSGNPGPVPAGYPPIPGADELNWPDSANVAPIIFADFGEYTNADGTVVPIFGGKRTLLGIAELREATTNPYPPTYIPWGDDQLESLEPPTEPLTLVQPRLCSLNFISDTENGVVFSAKPLDGEGCISFDETIGPYGGFRIPLCVDGLGDGVQDPNDYDCDAQFVFLAQFEAPPDAGEGGISADSVLNLTMTIDLDIVDNVAWINDPSGMDMPDGDGDSNADVVDNCTTVANHYQLDTDGDGFGNLCDADLNNDNTTNTLDVNLFKLAYRSADGDENFNVNADLNGDGVINTLDLNIFKGLYRKPPGPSCCGSF